VSSQETIAQEQPPFPTAPEPSGPRRGRLTELAPGTRALVVGVTSTGADATARRLAALGFTVGTLVDVVRRAPLGDPTIYRLKDYEVCLRRSEAARIHTREVPA
jgi:ferrous iron transport protein A